MIRIPFLTSSLLALSLATPAVAQLQVFGGEAPRMAATRIFWDNGPVGMVCIQYGQPEWKAEYDGMLGKLVGQSLRLGKDFWTTLNTSCALTVGGTKIPAGSYYLGLKCDEDGGFHLLVLRAEPADAKGWAPFMPEQWQPDFAIAMKKDKVAESAAKMAIALGGGEKSPTALTLSIQWGTHRLSAPVAVHLGEKGQAAAGAAVETVEAAVEAAPESGAKRK
jgi:hypothetical protein